MSPTRTQVYLTEEQRRRIDELTARDGVSLAEVIRRALDEFLAKSGADPRESLDATFGADPTAKPPSRDQWTRG